jgi:amino acid transporter
MTIAIQNAGWEGGVHLINTFIFLTCLSAVNSSIYIGSRTLLFMAQDGKAPHFLASTNRRGVPIPAILFTHLFGALSMMNISTGAGKAYGYIVNLSGVSTFLVWAGISFTHIRFRRAWALQGRTPQELPFQSWGYPFNAYFGVAANVFLALVQGWTTLSPFDAGNFVDAYILLALLPVVYFGHKLFAKTRYWRLDEIDLDEGRRRDLDFKAEVAAGQVGQGTKGSIWQRLWRNF